MSPHSSNKKKETVNKIFSMMNAQYSCTFHVVLNKKILFAHKHIMYLINFREADGWLFQFG